MRILHIDKNHPLLLSQLEAAGHENVLGYTLSKTEAEQMISEFDGMVIRSRFTVDAHFLEQATRLKFIARVGAGVESIDVDLAQQKGIHLISAPEGNRNAVGEHALGLLLSLMNNLHNAHHDIQRGFWNRETHRGTEIEGRTVGIIGYGHMGKAFAKKLSGFDCEVLCHDILEGVGDHNARQVPLKELQQKASILSLHTPWTPQTNQMVDQAFIDAFAHPFYFINTARGKSVVTKDLVAALEAGKILGAGLDVLEYENLSFESLFTQTKDMPAPLAYLLKAPNVLLTPHIAGWTQESKEKLAQTIVDKILMRFS